MEMHPIPTHGLRRSPAACNRCVMPGLHLIVSARELYWTDTLPIRAAFQKRPRNLHRIEVSCCLVIAAGPAPWKLRHTRSFL